MKITGDQKGRLAEEEACLFLEKKGYKIFAKRYKTPCGEIDLLVTKEETLIAVEVKYRKGGVEQAAESITPRQKRRIQKALIYFLGGHPNFTTEYPFIRFDVVLLSTSTDPVHIQNAWQIEDEFYEV